MSDKIKGFTVTLDADSSTERAALIKTAIMQIKGVISVEDHVTNFQDHMNRQQVKYELLQKISDVLT